jgi:hypothetical protein
MFNKGIVDKILIKNNIPPFQRKYGIFWLNNAVRELDMDLFTPVVEDDLQHKNFSSVLIPHRKAERELLEKWAEGFIDRDGKIVKEFQTTFNSSFWEIYLFSVFKHYGLSIDWRSPTPDFSVSNGKVEVIIEAVTANAAQGKPNEWDKSFSAEEMKSLRRFKKLNTEAIIRLSNSIFSKVKLYKNKYRKLDHVKGKPFVLAVAPFEQPHFNHQYDRPIKALLYDYYVDEDAYLDEPGKFKNGPPGVNLGFVEKDNGAEIELGIFNDPCMSEVSAIVFSCVATWGKLSAMTINPIRDVEVSSTWATPPHGEPEKRVCSPAEHNETVLDGLQIFHNPYAKYPLDPSFFRADRVVQLYFDQVAGKWIHEGDQNCLHFRQVINFPKGKMPSNKSI